MYKALELVTLTVLMCASVFIGFDREYALVNQLLLAYAGMLFGFIFCALMEIKRSESITKERSNEEYINY